jgi:hypothetical protein
MTVNGKAAECRKDKLEHCLDQGGVILVRDTAPAAIPC